jgi:hypothetical protein
MSTLTHSLPFAGLRSGIDWSAWRRAAPRRTPGHQDAAAASRDRRAFITDMLDRNADAFAGEQDVHNLMCLYPGRF